jgi:hypothetical protein
MYMQFYFVRKIVFYTTGNKWLRISIGKFASGNHATEIPYTTESIIALNYLYTKRKSQVTNKYKETNLNQIIIISCILDPIQFCSKFPVPPNPNNLALLLSIVFRVWVVYVLICIVWCYSNPCLACLFDLNKKDAILLDMEIHTYMMISMIEYVTFLSFYSVSYKK